MPRSKELSDQMRAHSQAQILAAARQLFATQGYFNCRVSEIAREASMSPGNVYWYFSSKEEVLKAVRDTYGVGRKALGGVRRAHWNEPRDVAIYLCRKGCGLTLKEIGALFSISAYTTVSMACGRVEERLTKDKGFRGRVEKLLGLLGSL